MFPENVAQWHAALNDLPSTLILLALAFELAADVTRRDSLRATGFWMLVVGAVGALAAVTAGLVAEDVVERGVTVHAMMERHEQIAIAATALFVILAVWRVWHRAGMRPRERSIFLGLMALGTAGVVWTAHIGGAMVFDHAAGVPTRSLEDEIRQRAINHEHESGGAPAESPEVHHLR
jgi:uncharacterized membrane protein